MYRWIWFGYGFDRVEHRPRRRVCGLAMMVIVFVQSNVLSWMLP